MGRSQSGRKSSKSPAAKPTPPKPGHDLSPIFVVGASTALKATGLWFFSLGFGMLVAPGQLLQMYKVPLDGLLGNSSVVKGANEYAQIVAMLQGWGLWMLCFAGICSYTLRIGKKKAMSLLCLANALTLVGMNLHDVLLAQGPALVKMPADGQRVNRAFSAVFVFMSVSGWHSGGAHLPELHLLLENPLEAPMNSNASRYVMLLCGVFGAMMSFNHEALLKQYGVDTGGELSKWYTLIFGGFGPLLLGIFLQLGVLLSADNTTAANGNRFMWCFMSMAFAQGAAQKTSVELIGNMPIEGVYFNLGLWFTGAMLCFRAMVAK